MFWARFDAALTRWSARLPEGTAVAGLISRRAAQGHGRDISDRIISGWIESRRLPREPEQLLTVMRVIGAAGDHDWERLLDHARLAQEARAARNGTPAARPGTTGDRSAAELKVEVLDGWQHLVDLVEEGPRRDERIAARVGLPVAEVRSLRHTRNLVAHPRKSPEHADLLRAVDVVRRARRRLAVADSPARRRRRRRRGRSGGAAANAVKHGGRSSKTPVKAWDEAHRMQRELEEAEAAALKAREEDLRREASRRLARLTSERAAPNGGRRAPGGSARDRRRKLIGTGAVAGGLAALWLVLGHGWEWLAAGPVIAAAVVVVGRRVLRVVATLASIAAVVASVVHLDEGAVPTGLWLLLGSITAIVIVALAGDQGGFRAM
ncbi:hypothetical protein [Saccharothrix hoggarensis]|uniref:Uncharacterized protein n=1 Tax=Saccharothrix hoggarensis TaxID=913853 RepID=A0ABW3QYZ5_9PSEU